MLHEAKIRTQYLKTAVKNLTLRLIEYFRFDSVIEYTSWSNRILIVVSSSLANHKPLDGISTMFYLR